MPFWKDEDGSWHKAGWDFRWLTPGQTAGLTVILLTPDEKRFLLKWTRGLLGPLPVYPKVGP